MQELGPENVVEYLHAAGHLPSDVPATARALTWGVSNVVLRIEPESGPAFVVKQSRAQLRTRAEWFSRLERIWREVDFMRAIGPLLPPGVVPRVLFEDRANYLFGMEAVAADHIVWKQSLLAGEADPTIARKLGRYLSTIHRETANPAQFQEQFADWDVFFELRVDPFYQRVANVHPDLGPAIERMIAEMTATRVCLVHADFSPKNILITPSLIALVDYETGHWGDPAFDLGFFLSHLLLKTVPQRTRAEEYLSLVRAFWTEYLAGLEPLRSQPHWTPHALSRRTVPHLAGCMLARIDGKSTIDYLPELEQQNLVREYCRELFLEPVNELEAAFRMLEDRL